MIVGFNVWRLSRSQTDRQAKLLTTISSSCLYTTMSRPTTMTISVSRPQLNQQTPQFYKTIPPPHWSNVNVSKRKFKSPWKSSHPHGILTFLKARLFDWVEPPLPPKVATQVGDPTLPPVRKPTWTATTSQEDSLDGGVTFTWLGHASCHLQIPVEGGKRVVTVLCDPVLSRRCSPFQWLGPERYTDSPTTVEEMIHETAQNGKPVWPDIVVLSHNHYDHTDFETISKLVQLPTSAANLAVPHFFCTLGNKVWFQQNFGLSDDQVTECDWWQEATVSFDAASTSSSSVKLTCVPAQHFSGRGVFDRDQTLWAGWTFDTGLANIYFAGDTGYRSVPRNMPKDQEDTLPYCPAFQQIGDILGPFDLSLIPIGAYEPRYVMSTVHLAPQDSVHVHKQVKSKKSYGIHWGSFRLTPEDVNQPPQRLLDEAKAIGLEPSEFGAVEIGQSVLVPTAAAAGTKSTSTEAAVTDETEQQLPESKLGTKSHWDDVYQREVSNFDEIGEEGEVWFGEEAVTRMIRYLENYYTESAQPNTPPPSVLDLGTGNGHLLFEMVESLDDLEDVFQAKRMVGVDYSENSIELANKVAETRGGSCQEVAFFASDLTNPSDVEKLRNYTQTEMGDQHVGWDLVCDKGTMDAIALSSQPIDGKLPIQLYLDAVSQLVKNNGLFLITSCNFTQDELTDKFTKNGFQVEKVVPTPTFTFGGSKGSSTTLIAFRRKE